MGLIKALTGSVGSTFSDQWKEYFYCEALEVDVLVSKGISKSSNNKGNENIITNGSEIAVADGQCMIIVEQGKVVELCAEPGAFTFDSSTEPSIFSGNLGTSIIDSFKTIGKRFTFGGEIPKDQRIYYFNTKEILGNKYGTPNPIPFRVVDNNIGLDIDISIRCNGEYSYKIANPMLFYTNVCGNVDLEYNRENIDSMLKSELMTALQPAFAKISAMGVRYSALPGYTMELADALNQILSQKWKELRGIEVASFSVNSVTASKEDEDMIKELQKTAVLRNSNMAAATLVGAQAQAMKDAANNEATGPMFAFAGMNMAQQAGGMNAQSLFQMGQQPAQTNGQQPVAQGGQQHPTSQPTTGGRNNDWKCACGNTNEGNFCNNCGQTKPEENTWSCSCGATNTGKFCKECGKAMETNTGWSCLCGEINTGRFCNECGSSKPVSYRCNKCGFEPKDPTEVPKFCGQCGDVFDELDQK